MFIRFIFEDVQQRDIGVDVRKIVTLEREIVDKNKHKYKKLNKANT